jgi:hypothetical protein
MNGLTLVVHGLSRGHGRILEYQRSIILLASILWRLAGSIRQELRHALAGKWLHFAAGTDIVATPLALSG